MLVSIIISVLHTGEGFPITPVWFMNTCIYFLKLTIGPNMMLWNGTKEFSGCILDISILRKDLVPHFKGQGHTAVTAQILAKYRVRYVACHIYGSGIMNLPQMSKELFMYGIAWKLLVGFSNYLAKMFTLMRWFVVNPPCTPSWPPQFLGCLSGNRARTIVLLPSNTRLCSAWQCFIHFNLGQ